MKTKNIILGIFSVAALAVSAQQFPLYSQYTMLPHLYNPSLVGKSGDVNASLLHRSQWKGIPGAPVTSVFTTEGAIQEQNMGLGMTIFNDNTDITQRIGFYGLYSYHLKLNEDQKLLFGLSVGVQNQRIDFSRAVIKDANDPNLMFQTAQRKSFIDVTPGVTYMWKTLEVGLSVPQLLGNKVEYNNTGGSSWFYNTQHYVFTAKYTHVLNEEKGMSIYPLLAMRYAKGAPFQFDFNAVFDWQKYGWAGLTYRHGYAMGINVGFRVNKTLRAGYAFDYSINSVKNFIGGAHEFFLGYTFAGRKTEDKPVEPPVASTAKTDSLLGELTAVNEKQNEEINKLKSELERLKSSQDSVKKVSGSVPGMQMASLSDFTNMDGSSLSKGYYVVIGAYKNLVNAESAKATNIAKYPQTNLIFNKTKNFHYVYVFKATNAEAASDVLKVMQKQYIDAWIFDLE
jgi:type IX secretion system PorP/SprF family membrane protein